MYILSFDIEDWYNHDDYSKDFDWSKYEVRIYEGVDKILTSLRDNSLKGTFFCLGWIAENHPSIIRKIAEEGHHIGCHSYQHELISWQTRKEFRDNTYRAKCLLEDIVGQEVDAYRTPSFSVTEDSLWVFEELADLGFKYDSSVFLSSHEFGGFPHFQVSTPFQIDVGGRFLKEFPINTSKFLNCDIIFSGGGYFRISPYFLIKHWMNNATYNMSYFHPSDFDPAQPKMSYLPFMRRVKNRIGLKNAYPKFQRYLNDFNFINIREADKKIDWQKQQIVSLSELKYEKK